MLNIDSFSIATLVLLFFLSMIFDIRPLSFYLRPFFRVNRRTRLFGLMTASILLFWAASQRRGACQARDGIGVGGADDILVLFISQVFMFIALDGADIFQGATDSKEDSDTEAEAESGSGPTGKRKARKKKKTASGSGLKVSDTVLGYGSQGTLVFRGSFQGRPVAVKRFLQDFVHIANREVSILQQSDSHPNVIRHYYQESQHRFVYLALELCPASLADIIENLHDNASERGEWSLRDLVQRFDAKRAMRDVANGLGHLHRLGLVHRDIKPQNILVSSSASSSLGEYRMLISDFGMCKKLDVDQSSFLPSGAAAGTAGWRAPEILCGHVKLYELPATADNSQGSMAATIDGTSSETSRLNKSVDIFALGCLYFYILTNGGHPYGDRFEREANVIKDKKDFSLLTSTEESTESQDLITRMLQRQPSQRPDTETCLLHPFFWDPSKRLGFLQDVSDRFEVICKDLKDVDEVLIRLERDAESVVGSDWHEILDQMLIDDLRQYRTYDGSSVRDLLRALRNKKHHYQDLSDDLKCHLGPVPEGFLGYFTDRYPRLLMHVHEVIKDTGLHPEPIFRTYFKLPEP